MHKTHSDINILGIKVSCITVSEIHSYIDDCIKGGGKSLILNVNANCINLAHKHKWLRDFLNSADIVFSDGAGVIIGAQILGYNIPERITYADWI